jgi:DNA-binding response OmpR family regulator
LSGDILLYVSSHAIDRQSSPGRLVALVPVEQVPQGTTVLGTLRLNGSRMVGPAVADRPSEAGVVVDEQSRRAFVDGRLLSLTRLEFDLLALFARTPRMVHTRDQLQGTVWNGPAPGGTRTVDVHVHRVRQKLGDPFGRQLVTLRGVGYRWDPAG